MIDRSEWLKILACPVCKQALRSLSGCDNCGIAFSESDGVPNFIPERGTRQVSFSFAPARSVAGPAFQNAFCYPPKRGAAGPDKPYHLDLAHLEVLQRIDPGSLVLEIGCGGGQMRTFVKGMNLRYIGTDVSRTRVRELLRAHGGPDLFCDGHFLPFGDGVFDLVYSAAVTEHLACPHLVVQEVARVLKPGGHYLGNVSFLEPWHDDSFFHMTPLGAFELLRQADFDIKHIWPSQGYSGFRSLLRMGNKVTRPLAFVGDLIFFLYNTGNRLRNRVKRRSIDTSKAEIADAARVAGATDWIARRRGSETLVEGEQW